MRTSTRLLVVCATILAVAPILAAPVARAQCSITGPTQVCPGDSIELCAPVMDDVSYLWRDPSGILYMTECIFAFEPGLYTLRMRDNLTRAWFPTCSLVVQSGRAAAPVITGPATACAGTPADWCGPDGNFEYDWSGPNGFAASTACVSVADAGDYLLRVRSLPFGCWGDSTVRTLTVADCQPSTGSCPRPAWWWAVQGSERNRRRERIERSELAKIATCVDDHATALEWSDDLSSFNRTMRKDRHSLRDRARRQFAAVWANVCAREAGMVLANGSPVSLDPEASLDLNLGGGTVGSWLEAADAELARLAHQPARSRSAKAAYRRLIRTGWHINHGRGIGAACQSNLAADAQIAVEDGMAMSEMEIESLAGEMLDDGDGPLSLGVAEPNPFHSQTTLAFSVSDAASAPVSIAVYDVSGRLVRELANRPFSPGRYVVNWDGSADDGSRVRSGLYFIRGRIGSDEVESRVSLVR